MVSGPGQVKIEKNAVFVFLLTYHTMVLVDMYTNLGPFGDARTSLLVGSRAPHDVGIDRDKRE